MNGITVMKKLQKCRRERGAMRIPECDMKQTGRSRRPMSCTAIFRKENVSGRLPRSREGNRLPIIFHDAKAEQLFVERSNAA